MTDGLEMFEYSAQGYLPLVYSAGWMVALLNYEPGMDFKNASEIERHKQTDEVFILLKGKAVFCLATDGHSLEVIELLPGRIYNVLKGTWHTLLATKDAAFAIVENRDTDKFDTEIRPMKTGERQDMLRQLPEWIK